MPLLSLPEYLLTALIDNILGYLIIYKVLNVSPKVKKYTFGFQVLAISIFDAIGSTYFPLNENRTYIQIVCMILLSWILISDKFWRALAGVMFLKVFEVLLEIIVAMYFVFVKGMDIQELGMRKDVFLTGIAFLYVSKLLIFWVLDRWKITFYKNPANATTFHAQLDQVSIRFTRLVNVLMIFVWTTGIYCLLELFRFGAKEMMDFILYFVVAISIYALVFSIQKQMESKQNMLFKQEMLEYKDEQLNLMIQQSKSIEYLFTQLRAERHDFVNHVQVVQGLIQSNRGNQAMEYIGQVSMEIKQLNAVVVKGNPFLSALLLVKITEADKKNILMDLQLVDNLNGVAWKVTEMSVIIGNIINNAIEAFDQNEESDRVVEKRIWMRTNKLDAGRVKLVIGNNAAPIPQDRMEQILNLGFTTKSGNQGVGLASVTQILSRIGGELHVTSNLENGTEFIFDLPVTNPISNQTNQVDEGELQYAG